MVTGSSSSIQLPNNFNININSGNSKMQSNININIINHNVQMSNKAIAAGGRMAAKNGGYGGAAKI